MTTFQVTTVNDVVNASDAVLSLREPIGAANTSACADRIEFANVVQGQTIVLTGGELVVAGDITIDGGTGVNIDANDTSRVLRLAEDTTAAIAHLTITGGSAVDGGGILVEGGGSLSLTEAVVAGNAATGRGGSIQAARYTSLTLTDTTVSDNTADGRGGGIYGFVVTASRSTISGNQSDSNGGGIYAAAAAQVVDSTIYDNSSGYQGGRLFVSQFGGEALGGLRLINSTMVGNRATSYGGGVLVIDAQRAYFANSIVAGNTAGSGSSPDAIGRFVPDVLTSNGNNVFGSNVTQINAGDVEQVATSLLFSGGLADDGGPDPDPGPARGSGQSRTVRCRSGPGIGHGPARPGPAFLKRH
jgi:predicted outer membrane repeat protein